MLRTLLIVLVFLLSACGEVESTVDQPRTMYASDEENGVFSIVLPPFWAGLPMQDGSLLVGNDGTSVRSFESVITDLETGMTAGSVSAVIKEALAGQIEDSAPALLTAITDTMSARTDAIRYTFGSIDEQIIAARSMAIRDGLAIASGNPDSIDDDRTMEVRVIVVDAGAAYGVLFVASPFGELESYFEAWNGITASFQFMTAEEARATQSAQGQ